MDGARGAGRDRPMIDYPLPFGTTVAVRAAAFRVVRSWDVAVAQYQYAASRGSGHGWEQHAPTADWPTERPHAIYARMVRAPFDDPVEGIVVGCTWRVEGEVVPLSITHGDMWGPGEADGGWVENQRRVPMVQVALKVADRRRARVVLARPEDVVTPLAIPIEGGGTIHVPAMLLVARRNARVPASNGCRRPS
jgi:hypothetical protein